MRIAVCDDEKEVREIITEKVRKMYPEEDIVSCSSGKEVINGAETIDILFLDIQMPGMDGMETAESIRRVNQDIIIIFVSAIEKYVFHAFDVGAFHYLVKPFSDSKFEEVLNNAIEYHLRNQKTAGRDEDKNIVIKSGGIHIKVNLADILYAEVFNRKILLHKMDEDIEYYGKMSELEKYAGSDFFRTHRAYLVHFKYVEKYDMSTGITIGKGNKLELDEDALNQANITTLKALFTGHGSFADKVSQKANSISNAAVYVKGTYNRSGTYSNALPQMAAGKVDKVV